MREICKYRLITGMQHGYCLFIVIISACTCFEKNWRTGNSNGECLCYPSNKNQVPENSF